MPAELTVGEFPKDTYYTIRGNTHLNGSYRDLIKQVGPASRTYDVTNQVWIFGNVPFIRPQRKVRQCDIDLLNLLDGTGRVKKNEPPTEDEQTRVFPFGTFSVVDYDTYAVVGGDGSKSQLQWWKHSDGSVTVYDPFEDIKTHYPFRKPGWSLLGNNYKNPFATTEEDSKTKKTPDNEQNPVEKPADDEESDGGDMFGLFD